MSERVNTSVEDPDAQLMLLVRQGDTESFRFLVEKHRCSLVYFLQRMVRDVAAAEDLAQEVFLKIYRARGSYEPSAKFSTWMFRIATRRALNWLRDERSDRRAEREDEPLQVSDRRPNVEQAMLEDVRLGEIRSAIAELPANQRAAVLMHKYEQMDYSQIAEALETTESAVKSLLFRAYEALRARLGHLASRTRQMGA